MARGKKYTDEIKEKAYFMYAACGNFNEVSRQLGIRLPQLRRGLIKKNRTSLTNFVHKRKWNL